MRDEIKIFAAALIGKSLDKAKEMAEFSEYIIRVVEKDGESLLCTMDLRFNRINVKVSNNIITHTSIG